MCKKLMFLISLVLLLVLGTSSQAADWTNASPWSVLFADPLNWDPEGIPGPGDNARIEDGPAHGPVLDRQINIDGLRGPYASGDANQFMLIIGDANVIVDGSWEASGGDGVSTTDIYGNANVEIREMTDWEEGLTILNMTDDSRLYVDGYARFAGDGGCQTTFNLSGNAVLEYNEQMRMADDGFFELNVSGNASVISGYRIRGGDGGSGLFNTVITGGLIQTDNNFNIGDDGSGTLEIHGGLVDIGYDVDLRARNGSATVALIMTDGVLNIAEKLNIAHGYGVGSIDISGGTITMGNNFEFANDDPTPTCVMNMTGGSMSCDAFEISRGGGAVIYFDGGTIHAQRMIDHHGKPFSMDFTDGVMTSDMDIVADTEEDIALGYITGHGGCGGRGDIMVDYNNVNPGMTTIWSEGAPSRAWNPNPVCDEIGVDKDVDPSWSAGDGALQHYIFLSSDEQKVIDGHITAYQGPTGGGTTTIEVGTLLLGTVYYWRVDTVIVGDYIVGQIWSFTVQANDTFDDFEDYSSNPNYVYDTWVDGVVDTNSGSWLDLAVAPDDPVHGGDQALWYHYDNSGVERECPYSAATRTMDPALDLTDSGEATLVIWFYGQPDNDPTRMYVELRDGIGGAAVSEYGVLGDDPNDILVAEWTDWNIDLADFGGVDLSDVTEFVIGFGHGDCEGPDEFDYGVVYFDDIAVYPTRCVPKYGPEGDLNDDCKVNWKDIDVLAGDWIEDRR